MSKQTVPINRMLVGLLTLACFFGAFVTWYWELDDANQMWLGGFVRVGLLMGAFWLALPSRGREAAWANMSPWTLVGVVVGIFVVVRNPRLFIPLLIGLATIGFFLRPRNRSPKSVSRR